MVKVTQKVTHHVPAWNYCNWDNLRPGCEPSTMVCSFCQKGRDGAHCLLYDSPLSVKEGFIDKDKRCARATAYRASVSEVTNDHDAESSRGPTINPKDIIEYAINEYLKVSNGLVKQGYPKALADKVSRKYILSDK